MIKVLHTADVHIGVENYGRIDNSTGLHSRLLDFAKTLNFCIDKAIDEDVDLFILAGDAYKTAVPTPTHQKILFNALLRLQVAGIQVVIVVGNHDHPVSFGRAHALDIYSDLPMDGFYVFSKPEIKNILTKRGIVQVVGIPWPSRQNLVAKSDLRYKEFDKVTTHISCSVAEIIKNLASQLDQSLPAVLTGHLTVNNGVFSGSEKRAVFGNDPLFTPGELAIAPFNYVALGHLHRYQSLNLKGQTPVVYSGSLDRIDFGEVRDSKGFVIVEIDTIKETEKLIHRFANVNFIQTPVREMVVINVFLEKESSDPFTKQILAEIKKYDLVGSIVKLFYHIPSGAVDTVDLGLINKALEDAWFIVGVIPVVIQQQSSRNQRTLGKNLESLVPEDLLKKYLTYKNLSSNEIDSVVQKYLEVAELVAQEATCNAESSCDS